MTIKFHRITEARELRCMSIIDLAKELDVTRQSISYYEQGKRIPSDKMIREIAKALNFPYEFFYKEKTAQFSDYSVTFFRSLKTNSAKSRTAIKRINMLSYSMFFFLEQYLSLPKLDFPNLDFLLRENLNNDDIEAIANETRRYWALGENPIENLITLFESKGVIITNGQLKEQQTDACSTWIEGRPIITLGSTEGEEGSAFRQTFNLAHELGHLLLHGHLTQDDLFENEILDKIEKEANEFAGHFLMPRTSFLNSLYSTSLDFFVNLKTKWKVSVSAMVYRCYALGIISTQEHVNIRKQLSYKRWRLIEPLDKETHVAKPYMFYLSLNLLFKNNVITRKEAIDYFSVYEKDLNFIFSLPDNLLNPQKQINIELL